MRVSTETVTFAGMHHTRAPLVVGTYPLLKDDVPWPLDDPPTSLDRTVDIYKQEQKINKKQQINKQTKKKYANIDTHINSRICGGFSWPSVIIILLL